MGDIRTSALGGIPFGNNSGRPSAQTGQPYFNGEAARLELYTQNSGWQNIVQETPGVASISGTYLESAGSGVITISGTNFVSGCYATAIGTNGIQYDATTTTFNSIVQITATFSGLSNAYEPYDIKVTNPSNLFGIIPDALYINAAPAWQTAAGSLGAFADFASMTLSATATDSDSTVTYSLASGSSLPSGITLNSSTGVISGTTPDVLSDTTYTFTINASDGVNTVVPRTFNFTVNAAPVWSTDSGSLGTFSTSVNVQLSATDADSLIYSLASGSLPTGITLSSSGLLSGTLTRPGLDTTYSFSVTASDGVNSVSRSFSMIILANTSGGIATTDSTNVYRVFKTSQDFVTTVPLTVDVIAIGGGGGGAQVGGGAGGLIVANSKSINAGTYSFTVGQGGAVGQSGQNTVAFGHTANGGGHGGLTNSATGGTGGSGGGAGRDNGGGGSANQGSGTGYTGYGHNGGNASGTGHGGGGGGGGAGAAGQNGGGDGNQSAERGGNGGAGHNGKASVLSAIASIMPSDWQTVTSTGYIGGGGGTASNSGSSLGTSGSGGAGGGGRGFNPSVGGYYGDPGINHTGGGGGSSREGGHGVIILKYPKSQVGL